VSVCVYKRTHSQLQAGVIHIINCIGASRLQDKCHREIAIKRPATISTRPKRTNSIYDLTWQSLFCFFLFFFGVAGAQKTPGGMNNIQELTELSFVFFCWWCPRVPKIALTLRYTVHVPSLYYIPLMKQYQHTGCLRIVIAYVIVKYKIKVSSLILFTVKCFWTYPEFYLFQLIRFAYYNMNKAKKREYNNLVVFFWP
jgi:hypothetical protein